MPARIRRTGSILVLGDINVDVIGRVKAWPEPGDDCLAPRLEMHCGGVAANCAFALLRWGVPARLLGCVGRDEFGDYMLRSLKKSGVDVRWVQRTRENLTGMVYINVTPNGQRTFFGSRGANQAVRPLGIRPAMFRGAAAAILMGYNFLDPGPEKLARQILKVIRARGGWVSLDVGMAASKEIPRKILRLSHEVDILFASGDEAAALTATRDPHRALAALHETGAREIVLKLGKRGCLFAEGGALRQVPAFAVHAVDSTGAGDAFVAAFLQARLRGWSNFEAAVAANAAGAVAASVVGAGQKLPGALEVARLLRAQRLGGEWGAVRLRVLRRLSGLRGVFGRSR